MDNLPTSEVKDDSSYWLSRYNTAHKFKSRKEIFEYMKTEQFHPVLMQVLKPYKPLEILVENVNSINSEMFIQVFVHNWKTVSDLELVPNMPELIIELVKTIPKDMYETNFHTIACKFAEHDLLLDVLLEKGYKVNIHYLGKDAIEQIISRGKFTELIDMDMKNIDIIGRTPLQKLIGLGFYKESLLLLDLFKDECNTYWVDKSGDTALITLCKSYTSDPLREVVAIELISYYDCNQNHVSNGKTAFLEAVLSELSTIVDLMLIKWGECIPSTPDPDTGCTALIGVIKSKVYTEHKIKVATMLIDNYPNLCFPSSIYKLKNKQFTALTSSILEYTDLGVKIIDKFGIDCCPGLVLNDATPLTLALECNSNTVVALKLIETFGSLCNVNYLNDEENALFGVCKCYDKWTDDTFTRAVVKLVESGCDLTHHTYLDRYALDMLLKTNVLEKHIMLLLDCGYDPAHCRSDLYEYACRKKYNALIARLKPDN